MYLTQSELKARLKQLNKDVKVYTYPDYRPVNAVYYRGSFICSIPKGNIYEYDSEKYHDGRGHKHRGLRGLGDMLATKKVIHPRDKSKLWQ